MAKQKKPINWICFECARPFEPRRYRPRMVTSHGGVCDVCGKERAVVAPRDFGLDENLERRNVPLI